MAVIELGRRPDLLRVMLVANTGFSTQVKLAEGQVFTTPPELDFPNQQTTWVSSLSDPATAVFSASDAQVNLLLAKPGPRNAILKYGDATWSIGNWESIDIGGRAANSAKTVFEIGVTRPLIEVDNLPAIGGPAEPAFQFTQSAPASTWIITHNLGRFPYVDIYVDNEIVEADVESSANVTTITFPIPYAGHAAIF